MLAQSRVRRVCAELGALQSTHSPLLLGEELTMTIRDREEEERVSCGHMGCLCLGKALGLV